MCWLWVKTPLRGKVGMIKPGVGVTTPGGYKRVMINLRICYWIS